MATAGKNEIGETTLKRCACGILLKEGRILLGKRASHRSLYPNTWDTIGGHCLPGEDPASTLIRELQEEIDITPTAFGEVAILHESQPHIYGEREYHVYVVTAWTGQGPTALGEEHSEIRWFPVDEALRLDLPHPEYAELFEAIQRQNARQESRT